MRRRRNGVLMAAAVVASMAAVSSESPRYHDEASPDGKGQDSNGIDPFYDISKADEIQIRQLYKVAKEIQSLGNAISWPDGISIYGRGHKDNSAVEDEREKESSKESSLQSSGLLRGKTVEWEAIPWEKRQHRQLKNMRLPRERGSYSKSGKGGKSKGGKDKDKKSGKHEHETSKKDKKKRKSRKGKKGSSEADSEYDDDAIFSTSIPSQATAKPSSASMPSSAPLSDSPTRSPSTSKPSVSVVTSEPTTAPNNGGSTVSPQPTVSAITSAPSVSATTDAPSMGTNTTEGPMTTPPGFVRCFNTADATIPCPPTDLAAVCDKYNTISSFLDCYGKCIEAFCCIHDSQATRSMSCSTETNCKFYSPCYIIWWKLHDTIGPAPFLRLEQDEAFYDYDVATFQQELESNVDFYNQFLGHHFMTDDLPLTDDTFRDPANW